jgi:hypothetical protein
MHSKKPALGCLSGSGILAAALTMVIVAGFGFARGGVLYSPGELNAQTGQVALGGVKSHAELSTRCEACHAAPFSGRTMADLCKDCHTELGTDPKNFHNVMLAEGTRPGCFACHGDHHGPTGALIKIDPAGFPHAATGYSLKAHQQTAAGAPFACSDCHAERLVKPALTVCSDCHAKIDPAFMPAHLTSFGPACRECHDGLDSYGKLFDHNAASFPLTGKHALAACEKCHAGAASIQALKATPAGCFDCHARQDAHAGAYGTDCAACHSSTGWKPANFDHNRSQFKLEGRHASVECARCHVPGPNGATLYKGTPQECAACHAKNDPHKGSFGSACAGCHAPSGWKPAKFDHALSAFPLTGKHVSVQCQACHIDNVFKAISKDCYTCHAQQDEHKGAFGKECSGCHTTASWEGAKFDHSKGAFPLDGAHGKVKCESCHKNAVFKGTPTVCAQCHKDPVFHQGLFPADCKTCHTTAAWRPASFKGQHAFPLNHGRAKTCKDCHVQNLKAYTCYTCHNRDQTIAKHREEVGGDNIDDCIRCHPDGRNRD